MNEINHQSSTSDSQPTIVEWYVNTAAGLEHGFDLPAPPGVKTGEEPLRVALELAGDLKPHLGCFSLSDVKNIGTFGTDGGVVTLTQRMLERVPSIAGRLRSWRLPEGGNPRT